MSETTPTSFATSALRRCSPQFQVISLITVFLSILLSTIYVTLYAPLERIALITLAFIVWRNQRSPSIHQLPELPLEPSVSLHNQHEPVPPAYTPKPTVSTIPASSDESDVSLCSVHVSTAQPPQVSRSPSVYLQTSTDAADVSVPSIPQSIFSVSPIVEVLDQSSPSSQSTLHPVTSVKVASASSFIDSSVSASVNETIQRRKLFEQFASISSTTSTVTDISTEPYNLPPLIDADNCKAYVNTIVGCPPPKDIVPRSVKYTSLGKLPTAGYIKPVRLINESADGILEWEFPHQNGIDYRIQVTA